MKKEMMNKKLAVIKGFTLIELLVAMVIIGILAAVGVPGMQTLLANNTVRSTSDRLINSLAYARGEAVARVASVSVRSATGTVDWGDGWTVFIDVDASCTINGADEVLRVIDRSNENVEVESVNESDDGDDTTVDPPSTAVNCIGFDRLGEYGHNSLGANLNSSSFTIEVDNATARTITVGATGYTRLN